MQCNQSDFKVPGSSLSITDFSNDTLTRKNRLATLLCMKADADTFLVCDFGHMNAVHACPVKVTPKQLPASDPGVSTDPVINRALALCGIIQHRTRQDLWRPAGRHNKV